MPTPTKSPILDFLTSKENTAPVLEVLRYASEIREEIATRFWSKFEESLKQAQPSDLPVQLSWKLDLGWKKRTELLAGLKGHDFFGLEALFPGSRAGEAQGVRYRIELSGDWFGVGLAWLKWEANNFETLCRVKPVKVLQAELKEKRSAYFSEGPDNYWL